MNFKNWLLNEMPLKHYGHEFHSSNSDTEVFDKSKKQYEINPTSQDVPWGGKIKSTTKDPISGKFSKKDKIIISHPKTARILEEKLKKSKYNFNILLIEKNSNVQVTFSPTSSRPILKGYPDQIENYMKENNLQKENHITFVKLGTTGHLLTPWMILHNLGHAITDHLSKNRSSAYEKLDRLAYDIYDIYPQVFLFQSATSRKVEDSAELTHELIAEYLWHGKIRVNNNFNEKNIKLYTGDEYTKALWSDREHLISQAEEYIDECLKECVGEIIYDI